MKVEAWGFVIDEWPGGSVSWKRGDVSYLIGFNPSAGSWPPKRRTQRLSHLVTQSHWVGPLIFHRRKMAPLGEIE